MKSDSNGSLWVESDVVLKMSKTNPHQILKNSNNFFRFAV